MIPCQPTLVNPKIKKDSFHKPTQSMTQGDGINRMEDHLIDMRLAVSALLETVTQHQRNFETIQRNFETVMTEIRDIRLDMQEMRADMQEMQSQVRGLQTENRRILDILQNRHNNGDS